MARRGRRSSGPNWAVIGGVIAAGVSLIPLVPKLRRRAMQPTLILKKDHRKVSALLMSLEMTPRINSKIRKTLFDQIYHNLMVHAQAEEEVIYPAMRTIMAGQGENTIGDAYREHQIMKDLLHDMSTMDPMMDAFNTKLAQLKAAIQHHVEEEETHLFELMKERMSQDHLNELGQRLHNRKKDLQQKTAA